jgi:multiple sugar transport system permease protein
LRHPSVSALFATAVFTFVFAWNDFIFALVMTRSAVTTYPVQVTHYPRTRYFCKAATATSTGSVPSMLIAAILAQKLDCAPRHLPRRS